MQVSHFKKDSTNIIKLTQRIPSGAMLYKAIFCVIVSRYSRTERFCQAESIVHYKITSVHYVRGNKYEEDGKRKTPFLYVQELLSWFYTALYKAEPQ